MGTEMVCIVGWAGQLSHPAHYIYLLIQLPNLESDLECWE